MKIPCESTGTAKLFSWLKAYTIPPYQNMERQTQYFLNVNGGSFGLFT